MAGEAVWIPKPLADGDRRLDLTFKYRGKVNLERLKAFSNPASNNNDAALANFNFDPLVTHLNNVISKSMSDVDVFQTSSHRFYFKNGHEDLDSSKSLCTMRGYDYTVKSAMEKVLLNVNAATSAFFRPITVAEFMLDTKTFAKNEIEKRIKDVKVYIIPDRKSVQDAEEQKRVDDLNKPQNRIKTVKSLGLLIGDRTDDTFKFRRWIKVNDQLTQEQNQTHVIEHMKNVFGREHEIDLQLKAVNVGSDDDPVWYPQEFLRILPYQMYTNLLPDQLVEHMLKNACRAPPEIRAHIESEGLKGLGITREDGLQAFVSFSDARLSKVANILAEQVQCVDNQAQHATDSEQENGPNPYCLSSRDPTTTDGRQGAVEPQRQRQVPGIIKCYSETQLLHDRRS